MILARRVPGVFLRARRGAFLAVVAALVASSGCSDESSKGGTAKLPFAGLRQPTYVAVDARGTGTVMWQEGDGRYQWALFSPGGALGAISGFEPPSWGLGTVVSDREGHVTAWYLTDAPPDGRRVLQRYNPGGAWSELPVPSGFSYTLKAAPRGRLLGLDTENDETKNTRRLVAYRYEPSNGWAPAETMDEAPTLSGAIEAASYEDGGALVTWARSTGDPMMYERFVPGAGWTGVKTSDVTDSIWDLLSADDGATMMLASKPTNPNPGRNDDSYTVTSRLFSPEGPGAPQIIAADASNLRASAMGRGGAAIVAWLIPGKVRAHYYAPSTGWRQIDVVDPNIVRGHVPLVGVDGRGRAVVVWGAGVNPRRGYNAHVFSARYDPASGWTAPTQIDPDGAAFYGPLAVNDAGDALLLWTHDSGGIDTDPGTFTHWVTRLP